MNILFIYTSEIIPENGGVQRVTFVLKNYFEKQNIKVFCLSLNKDLKQKNHDVDQYFLPHETDLYHEENISFFINFIKQQQIDIVINQAALGGTLSKFCAFAKRVPNVKVISVIHNSLLGNVVNFTNSHAKQLNKIPIPFLIKILDTKLLKVIMKFVYILKYKRAYTFTCDNSDKVVLLSKEYYDELRSFVPCFDANKICAIPNPCTIISPITIPEKINEIVYVGRINTSQKKVDLLLNIWQKIYMKYPNWNLSIVGDGEERFDLEKQAKKLGLERIKFCGLQNPIPFYGRAKILCMTSAYEGFPLVLAEAQVFGTIPIAFDSFASIKDIIHEGQNGFLIEPFNIDKYSKCLCDLINNEEMIYDMNLNCQKSARDFSIEMIGEKWLELFNLLRIKSVEIIN